MNVNDAHAAIDAENSDEVERECMRAALDAVRGDSDAANLLRDGGESR